MQPDFFERLEGPRMHLPSSTLQTWGAEAALRAAPASLFAMLRDYRVPEHFVNVTGPVRSGSASASDLARW